MTKTLTITRTTHGSEKREQHEFDDDCFFEVLETGLSVLDVDETAIAFFGGVVTAWWETEL